MIFYRESTGLTTPQGDKLDYFIIKDVGVNMIEELGHATILFYEKLEHAQSLKVPNAERRIEWAATEIRNQEAGVTALLQMENVETTSGDIINLKGAELC
jgi:cellobiose-specific phosphotransferase system component IIA